MSAKNNIGRKVVQSPRTLRVPAATKTLQQVRPRSRTLLGADAVVFMRWWQQRSLNDRPCVYFVSIRDDGGGRSGHYSD